MDKWTRFKYLPAIPLGEDGKIVTGSKEHINLSHQAAAEGMVLLKNEQNVLPLKKGAKVALFGKGSADYVKGGGGSGDVTVAYVCNLCDGMEEKAAEGKVEIYAPLHEFYRENVKKQYEAGTRPGYTVEPEIPMELLKRAAKACDMAIISICRFSAEGWDRKGEPNDGDFYLSPEEQRMVADVVGNFAHVAVVLNVGGMVDTSWFIHEPKIQSVLLAWQGGMEGALAEADILCGDANPCGKLTDTFAASFDDYPSSANFNESEDYVCYTDDIFVGYRYFETIPGAAEKVNYPFGFGLSYTTFAWQCKEFRVQNNTVFAEIAVKNTGSIAGKEVIQLYSAALPCRFDMPHKELRAFKKTKLLQPGETQNMVLSFPLEEAAVYDEVAAAYILPAVEFSFLVGTDVRSTKCVGSYKNEAEKVVFQTKNYCVPRKLPCRLKADGSYETLEMQEYAPKPDTSDWPEKMHETAEHILPNGMDVEKPKDRISFEKVAQGKAEINDFINSLTVDEMITLAGGTPNRGVADTRGIGGIEQLDIPAIMTADGPAGLRIVENRGVNTTAWPVATLLACTWNPDLIFAVGRAGAKEVKENNIGMWLTPAVNIHRSPLCGRNFEYYSEDPYLAGQLASAMVQGIQSQNISACVKHFCCNNKETNRKGSDSRLSERALREIYLKAFQIVVREAKVWAVMTAYNQLNGTYTSENRELLQGILRGEWGFDGLVLTDWDNWAEQYREILAGNNVRMPFGSPKRLKKAYELGLITEGDLRANLTKLFEFMLKLD